MSKTFRGPGKIPAGARYYSSKVGTELKSVYDERKNRDAHIAAVNNMAWLKRNFGHDVKFKYTEPPKKTGRVLSVIEK